MNMGEKTYYVSNFVSELAINGLEDVVISPGSRSTPLAMTFAENPMIKEWVHFDERSSAFFALGLAKKKNKPVALVCTSGTAAANYYPAIVEAHYSRIPLIVLTADRPHELRDNGAPQAIDQIKMFHHYTKYFHEMALPESTESSIRYARRQASRAYMIANSENKGVVQLNFPFRDPLIPDLSLDNLWGNRSNPILEYSLSQEHLPNDEVKLVLRELSNKHRGLIVCGELKTDTDRRSILKLATELKIPILADVLSNLRKHEETNEYIISTYDAILKDDFIKEQLKPEFIIRFGSMPVSKPYMQWITRFAPEIHIVVDTNLGYREPTNIDTMMVYSHIDSFVSSLINVKKLLTIDNEWTNLWIKMDEISRDILSDSDGELTEGTTALALSEVVKDDEVIFVGNSMPIRDMDTFYLPSKSNVEVIANRGVNGIDGVVSTAIGISANQSPTTLLIGDVSFLHDYTSLFIARQYNLSIRVIILNNNGGGIFSFLPQSSEKKHFEALFGTPFDPPIKKLTEALGGKYYNPTTISELKEVINKPIQGIEIIEVITNRDDNVTWHRTKWDKVTNHIKQLLKDESA